MTTFPGRSAAVATTAPQPARQDRTATTTSRTTTTTTTTTPAAQPAQVVNGKGDDVVSIDPQRVGPMLLTFECPKCSGFTFVQSDGFESILVSTMGAYSGRSWLDVHEGSKTHTLTVKADSSWTLSVDDLVVLASTPSGEPTISGHGDAVFYVPGEASKAKITNRGGHGGFFAVEVAPTRGGRTDMAVATVGGYEGTVPFEGDAVVQVRSDGDWTLSPIE
ncbi:hypothetical protein [Goodfellowiella coeruleoviolacea]|nr:hypothetical protein [Goodfellowiella coeruleoviolacea]